MQMTRRSFAGMCGALPALAGRGIEVLSQPGQRIYDIFGIPLRTGSLYPGTENDAIAYRDAGMMDQFRSAGIHVADGGDIPIPSFLPHHSIPPVRNWPGPRIAWDCVGEPVSGSLKQPGHIPLLIGCDCSIVVGTVQTLMRAGSRELHVLYIDGDFDDAAPQPHICNSAASFAVWFLTNASPFWAGPVLKPPQVTVIGWSVPSRSPGEETDSLSLAEIRKSGIRESATRVLERIPPSADILIHLDIDVLTKQEMPAAYFPHSEGFTLSECTHLLHPLVHDPRIRLIEISEYASLRDLDRTHIRSLLRLLTESLS
jgi:arginase family enzyme